MATAVSLVVLFPLTATAHTEVEGTTPADGAVLDEPVDQIVIAFTEPVTVVGDGFQILDPTGEVIDPVVETPDDTVFTLIPDAPLAGGIVAVRFEVTSDDGHVVTGSLTFTVSAVAPPPTTTTTPDDVSTTAPTTTTSLSSATTVSGPVTTVDLVEDDESSSGGGGAVWIALAAALGLGVAAWLVVRSRRVE